MKTQYKMDIEAFGITKSPLDPWRGSGRLAKKMGLPVPAPAVRTETYTEPDSATATITKQVIIPDIHLEAYKKLIEEEFAQRKWIK